MSGGGGGLPAYRSSARIDPQALMDTSTGGGGSMAALSKSFSDLQRTLTGAALDAADAAADQRFGEARRDALTAPIRDEAGNYTVPEPDFTSRAGRMSAETILGRIVDEETISGRERAVTMRAEVGGDPDQFRARWIGDIQGRVQGVPQYARERVGQVLRQIGVEHTNSQRMEVVQRDQRLTQAGWQDVHNALSSDLDGLARAGRLDSPEFGAIQQRLHAHLDRGVREHFISPETRQVTLDSITERVGGQALFRAALDRLDAGENPDAIARSFEEEADRRAIPPTARASLRGMLRTVFNEHEARQAHARSELRTDLEDWRNVTASGLVPFDPAQGVRLAERAEAAGDTSLAMHIRRQQQAFAEVASASTGSLPDLRIRQNALVEEMRAARTREEQAPILDRIRALRAMDEARTRQMRDDPFGTAIRVHAGKSGVGDVRPLDFSNAQTFGDQLQQRASVARLLGSIERMPDMPVMTAAEAESLAGVIRDGGPAAQLGLLTGLRRLPVDTMRRTLNALVPGEGRQQDARVGAFLVAAALTDRDPRASSEIVNGMERQRLTPIAALQGTAVDDAIMTRIGGAYRANGNALAAINAAARAIYTERASSGIDPSQGPRSNLDTPATTRFDTGLMARILDQIAPTVSWNGGSIPAPVRDGRPMTEAQVADAMAGLPSHVLAGARAANGSPVTANHIRGFGQLVAIREGQYQVIISGFPMRRIDGSPFTLDLNQPWPDAPDDFRQLLRQGESGHRAGIVNREGFAGLYQFGTERLAELSYYRPAPGEGRNGWRGTFTIPGFPQVRTLQDFLASPAAQEAAAEVHFFDIDDAITRLGTAGASRDRNGLRAAANMDRNGLRAVAHLGGVQGMRRFVETNGAYDPTDSNGTKLSDYYRRFSGSGPYREGANR
ncbi:hypothetical protein AAFN86_11645 [Roseomonas sp. CAU 1739]|uniref:hypothetical protein n=1 Tax=Roseomonas sp. CAU 1739 TaxID=3140364 RepID=UPI00325B136F